MVVRSKTLDINRLTFDVINYNIDNYTNENYNSRGELLDNNYIRIVVGPFENREEATEYYSGFNPATVFRDTGDAEVLYFIISAANLETFNSDRDPVRYLLFFREVYVYLKINRGSNNEENQDSLDRRRVKSWKPHIIFLTGKGYEVDTCTSGNDAIDMVKKEKNYDVIFLDEHMPGLSGIDTLRQIKEIKPDIPVVMITRARSIMEAAIGSKIADYLIKPVNPNQMRSH
ncbi:MAG: response regulator [Bacteroidales bacterium]